MFVVKWLKTLASITLPVLAIDHLLVLNNQDIILAHKSERHLPDCQTAQNASRNA